MSPIYHLTEGKAISERTKATLAAVKARDTGLTRPSAQSVSPGIAPYFSSAVLEAAVELNSKYSTVLIIEAASHEL